MREDTTVFPETTIGIDLGDRFSHGCRLDRLGTVAERFRWPTTRAGLAKAFAGRPAARVVLEVGTHSPWVSRELSRWGHEVIVANAREVQSITKSHSSEGTLVSSAASRLDSTPGSGLVV